MKTPWYIIMVYGLIDIANGLARIFSLGQWQPFWVADFIEWRINRYLKQQRTK